MVCNAASCARKAVNVTRVGEAMPVTIESIPASRTAAMNERWTGIRQCQIVLRCFMVQRVYEDRNFFRVEYQQDARKNAIFKACRGSRFIFQTV
jgi:dGTP triphosphohydrolase